MTNKQVEKYKDLAFKILMVVVPILVGTVINLYVDNAVQAEQIARMDQELSRVRGIERQVQDNGTEIKYVRRDISELKDLIRDR